MIGDRWRTVVLAAWGVVLAAGSSAWAGTTTGVDIGYASGRLVGYSGRPELSAQGRYVAFASGSADLVAGDSNRSADVFVRDLLAGTNELVSVSTSGEQADTGISSGYAMSSDARYIVFASAATNLAAGDTNGMADIFWHDRTTGVTERVSIPAAGGQPNGPCGWPVVSNDGRFVAFESVATNLVAGDDNQTSDIFVRDRQLGTTERVSVGAGAVQADGGSWHPSISSDGRYVAFESWASNLVAGDGNGSADIFVRDRTGGVTERVSVSSAEVEADWYSESPRISASGRFVAFISGATNLVDGDSNAFRDVFLRDRQEGTTERVSVSTAGQQQSDGDSGGRPAVTPDGRYVAFESKAGNLVAGDTNGNWDVFVRDRQSGVTERVSVSTYGMQGDNVSGEPALTADGRCVAFMSWASNLVPDDTNQLDDIFLRDRTPGAPTVVAVVPAANAVGVAPTATVNATFSEPMAPASITTGTFRLAKGGSAVAGTITYNTGTYTARLTPASPLGAGTYTATLVGGTGGVRDTDGNPLAVDYVWSFAVPDETPPTVSITSPAAGSRVQGVVSITVQASDASGINRVELSIDGVVMATDTTEPYAFGWNTRPLAVTEGAHTLTARAFDTGGNSAPASVAVIVDNTTFDDVPKTSGQWAYVEAIYREGITSGCSQTPKLFCPSSPVTRGQMAVFLCRAAGWSPYAKPTPSFADVPAGSQQYGYIEEIYRRGVTAGCSQQPLRYCPDSPVTRGQMAVFLCRAAGIATVSSPTPTFADVPKTSGQYIYIEGMYAAGITAGCSQEPRRYCPDSPVTRGQMAVFLCRAFDIPLE